MKRYIKSAIKSFSEEPELFRIDVALRDDLSLREIVQFADDPSDEVRAAIAQKHNLPVDVQEKLSKDPDVGVQGRLAHNPTVSPNIFRILYSYHNNYINWCLAKNPRVPSDILADLAKIDDFDTLNELVYNPSIPKESLYDLQSYSNDYISQAACWIYSQRYKE